MAKRCIRIIGGSLGGLFAAALLRQDGHDVKIYERSVGGLAGRGAGLVGQREIFAILRAVGCEHVAQVGVIARERIFLDRSGAVIERYGTPQTQISWDRLYQTFEELVADGVYFLGRSVRSVFQDETRATLQFNDGGWETADLLVGADGVGSVVRESVLGQPAPSTYAGYIAWRGLFPETELPPAAAEVLLDRFAFYSMPRSHILGYVVTGPNGEMSSGARRYNWVWYRTASGAEALGEALTDSSGNSHRYSLGPGALSADRRDQLLTDAAAQLPPPFAAAVAAEPRPFLQAIFDFETPKMANGRIALLGDAAFVVRPHTAMGVAKAAGDALALRAHLAKTDDIPSALEAYDIERRPAGQSIAASGRRLGKSLE
ncbi:FAD-dependent monooxygenase [Rhizobium calliandrae]|uniref:FAD-dependent monooxygenase n=1 Tax=Rhizobium calliandrae TaxID=1312182 RepID=A0ABT7KR39_9HYPH|nr:FAD-dependent monooxygenase [Rhizobium calliandrae]MDL2409748.1 FAD-dependent monooxygenase [Rhizobium calliandrae]